MTLGELEQILADDAGLTLPRRVDPARLEFLFAVYLYKLIRGGPAAAELEPRRLLAKAQRAAAAGVVPLATPVALRQTLEELEARLHRAGAWDPSQPLWWHPLPAPSTLEDLWTGLDGQLSPPSPAALDLPKGALHLPSLLDPSLTRAIWSELAAADRGDELALEPGAVGAAGRRSARRSDSVRYLSGLEPELLVAVPTLAGLVQWGLEHLANRLRVRGRAVHPPEKAMLARYGAPSGGFAPHLDNPGGEQDNGRTLTLVIYLNAPGKECAGGQLALWPAGTSTSSPPSEVLAPRGGSAALFDSRDVAHQVRPVEDGPARWALIFWFNDQPRPPSLVPARPRIELTDVLASITSPPLPAATVLFHELEEAGPGGEIEVRRAKGSVPRVGLLSTVYGEGETLDAWCAHHFALGMEAIVLVFDHLEEPREAAVAARLVSRYGGERLIVWSGKQAAERWRSAELVRFAAAGSASYAVAARQALNATAVLAAAESGELGGAPLDWLLHLDADELFYPQGSGRGGATLTEHFAAAGAAGLKLVRYANHELLLPYRDDGAPRFKTNPHLATARLGPGGWKALVDHMAMAQTDPRPYFSGYFNGKSAVAVADGLAAAGVHGWFVSRSRETPSRETPAAPFLAGPSVLHFHFSSPAAFRRKYLAIASSPAPEGPRLFEPSPVEEAAVALIRELRREGAGETALNRGLDRLHETLSCFSRRDVELLEEANLILRPELEQPANATGRRGDRFRDGYRHRGVT